MKETIKRRAALLRSLSFLLVLVMILAVLSQLSMALDRNRDPLYNYSARCLFEEPDNTIDVLAIGTSCIYSSIEPLELWRQCGATCYAWGEPAQRIYDTREYLKEIYCRQSPKVVLIDVSNLFRDETDAQNLDSLVKTQLSRVFPVVAYHRNLTPKKLKNWGADPHSLTKGYMLRTGICAPDAEQPYMEPTEERADYNALSGQALADCVALCQQHGSEVVLLAIPDYQGWKRSQSNTVSDLAEQWGVPFLDLNAELADVLDWSTDTPDGGSHLNYSGAEKVTAYLCQYLRTYALPDHRADPAYDVWVQDAALFFEQRDAALEHCGAQD
jgi:hypothetical protein